MSPEKLCPKCSGSMKQANEMMAMVAVNRTEPKEIPNFVVKQPALVGWSFVCQSCGFLEHYVALQKT